MKKLIQSLHVLQINTALSIICRTLFKLITLLFLIVSVSRSSDVMALPPLSEIPDYYKFKTKEAVCEGALFTVNCDECDKCKASCSGDVACEANCDRQIICSPAAVEGCSAAATPHPLCDDNHLGLTWFSNPIWDIPGWITEKEGTTVSLESSDQSLEPDQAEQARNEALASIPVLRGDWSGWHDPDGLGREHEVIPGAVYRGSSFICDHGYPEPVECEKYYAIDATVKPGHGDTCVNDTAKLDAGEKPSLCRTRNTRNTENSFGATVTHFSRNEAAEITEDSLSNWVNNDEFDISGGASKFKSWFERLQGLYGRGEVQGGDAGNIVPYAFSSRDLVEIKEKYFSDGSNDIYLAGFDWGGGGHAVILIDMTINPWAKEPSLNEYHLSLLNSNSPGSVSEVTCHDLLFATNQVYCSDGESTNQFLYYINDSLTTTLKAAKYSACHPQSGQKAPKGDLCGSSPRARAMEYAKALTPDLMKNFGSQRSKGGNCAGWSAGLIKLVYLASFAGEAPVDKDQLTQCNSQVLGEKEDYACYGGQSCCEISAVMKVGDDGTGKSKEFVLGGSKQCGWYDYDITPMENGYNVMFDVYGVSFIRNCHDYREASDLLAGFDPERNASDVTYGIRSRQCSDGSPVKTGEVAADDDNSNAASTGTRAISEKVGLAPASAVSTSPEVSVTYVPISSADKCAYQVIRNGSLVYKLYLKNNYLYTERSLRPTDADYQKIDLTTGYSTEQKNAARVAISDSVHSTTIAEWYWKGNEAAPRQVFVGGLSPIEWFGVRKRLENLGVNFAADCRTNNVPPKFETFLGSAPKLFPCGQSILGDGNGDGQVDENDVKLALDSMAGITGATPRLLDIDGNGRLALADLSLILESIGKPTVALLRLPESCDISGANFDKLLSFVDFSNPNTKLNVFNPPMYYKGVDPVAGDNACDGAEQYEEVQNPDCVRAAMQQHNLSIDADGADQKAAIMVLPLAEKFYGGKPQSFGVGKGQKLTINIAVPETWTKASVERNITARSIKVEGMSCASAPTVACRNWMDMAVCPALNLSCDITMDSDKSVAISTPYTEVEIPKSIVMTAPASGATLFAGQPFQIRWQAPHVERVIITASQLDARGQAINVVPVTPYQSGIKQGVLNSQSYVWNVPLEIPEGDYIIQASRFDSDAAGSGATLPTATSAKFRIAKPSITIKTPTAGSVYRVDDIVRITWDSPGVGQILIVYQKTGSSTSGWITPFDTARNRGIPQTNNGTYDWRIPSTLTEGDYTVQIFRYDPSAPGTGAGIPNKSSSPFKIWKTPRITVTTNGQVFTVGAPVRVSWESVGVGNVTVAIEAAAGLAIPNIYQGSGNGQTVWAPRIRGVYRFKVMSASDSTVGYSPWFHVE